MSRDRDIQPGGRGSESGPFFQDMRKIRKTGFSNKLPDRLAAIGYLTRAEAVGRVARYLKKDDFAAAGELVELFNLEAEELTEAGLPFETVKALEERCFLMRCFKS